MKEEEANVVSNYQNHFRLSLQAVWNWTSCFFYVIRNRWPIFSYSQNISGWAFHTFATSRASPLPPPFIIHTALKTPPSNTWPALLVYIFILLYLARTKGLLIFQEAGDFVDSFFWGFFSANLRETKQFLISYCKATVHYNGYHL